MIEVPMTEAQFAAAAARLQQHGIELAGRSGTITRQGVTADYEFADGKMRITLVKKPFLLPESLIESQLRAYLTQNPGSPEQV